MSGERDSKKGRIGLVGAEGASAGANGDEAALRAALGSALAPGELGDADHEALLAMTLGEEAAAIDERELAAAEALRLALEEPARAAAHPLAQLAEALRLAHGAAELAPPDHELLLAVTLGDETAELPRSEAMAAARLADALESGAAHPLADLARSLRAAHHPAELDPADHEALVAVGAGEDAAAIDEAERQAAAELARGLEPGAEVPARVRAAVELARALEAAHRGGDIDELAHERLVKRALAAEPPRRGRGAILGAIVALAAGVALMIGSLDFIETQRGGVARRSEAPAAEMAAVRSTQELFDAATPFPVKGGESERLSKIMASRSADLRSNRFAAWGVP